jgi:hypothetical protein
MVQEKLRLINNYKSYNGSKLRYLSLLIILSK